MIIIKDFMNEFDSLCDNVIDLIFAFPRIFIFPLTISLIISLFSTIIRLTCYYDISISLPSFKSHDSHNKKYDKEIRSLLCISPKETIDLLYEADKEYLVEYFTEHLSDFYDELVDYDDET